MFRTLVAVLFISAVAVAQKTTIFHISADEAALLSRKYAAFQQAQLIAQNKAIFRISADDAALLSRKYAASQQAQREWELANKAVAERHGAEACGLNFSTDFTEAVPRPYSTYSFMPVNQAESANSLTRQNIHESHQARVVIHRHRRLRPRQKAARNPDVERPRVPGNRR